MLRGRLTSIFVESRIEVSRKRKNGMTLNDDRLSVERKTGLYALYTVEV